MFWAGWIFNSCESFQFPTQANTHTVYVVEWGKYGLGANHQSLFPQLSYQCHWQLLLEEGWREQGKKPRGGQTRKETNNQANSVGKKQAKSSLLVNSLVSESLSGYDSAYGILAWWLSPVMLSVQSALIMDVRRCVRCHLHIACTLRIHKAGTCAH